MKHSRKVHRSVICHRLFGFFSGESPCPPGGNFVRCSYVAFFSGESLCPPCGKFMRCSYVVHISFERDKFAHKWHTFRLGLKFFSENLCVRQMASLCGAHMWYTFCLDGTSLLISGTCSVLAMILSKHFIWAPYPYHVGQPRTENPQQKFVS